MEDLFVVIIQAIFEIVASLPWDLFLYVDLPVPTSDQPVAVGFLSFVAGVCVGGPSLWLLPDVVAQWAWLRLTLLFVSPVISGFIASRIALIRQRGDAEVNPWRHFWWCWAFTCGLVMVRFGFAIRPTH